MMLRRTKMVLHPKASISVHFGARFMSNPAERSTF
jgi:hypothetical protein